MELLAAVGHRAVVDIVAGEDRGVDEAHHELTADRRRSRLER